MKRTRSLFSNGSVPSGKDVEAIKVEALKIETRETEAPYRSLERLIPIHLKDNPAPYYIANILREAIYRGLLADGEPLHQSLLAERLKVSPIPLREALRLLETEGLVDFRGRRGAVVTGLSAGETREIYEMLAALETNVLRIAFPSITEGTMAAAEKLLNKMEAEPDCIVWREQNILFHTLLYESADRPMTLDHIARLRQQVDRYIRLHLASMREESEAQHRAILEAVRARDRGAALEALSRHLEKTSLELQNYMGNEEE